MLLFYFKVCYMENQATKEVKPNLLTSDKQARINDLEAKIAKEKEALNKKLNRQKIMLGAFLIDALENDKFEGLRKFVTDNLDNFLTRKSDKEAFAPFIENIQKLTKEEVKPVPPVQPNLNHFNHG